jgi:lactate permease
MQYFLAALPLLLVIVLMMLFRWGGERAGPAGWLAGLLLGLFAFGLTPSVFQVSQIKGVQLSIFVLGVIWPALFLYHLVDQAGGIQAIPAAFSGGSVDRPFFALLLAWAFSGLMEGLAGFGLPIAVVAPMIVLLGIDPVRAVAAVAIGHSWSVTFGDMGVIFQTLVSVVNLPEAQLIPASAFLLGLACLACGLGAAAILRASHFWREILLVSLTMGLSQFALAHSGLVPLSAFGAGLAGLLVGIGFRSCVRSTPPQKFHASPGFAHALFSYGCLAGLMSLIFLLPALRQFAGAFQFQSVFPGVCTNAGFEVPAASGVAYRPLTHPGSFLFLVILLSLCRFQIRGVSIKSGFRLSLRKTWNSAAPASITIISMVGLSTLMDHCGMTSLLARGLSASLHRLYPLFSPLVGILGAFATGSNNNSNVLFGPLQKEVAGFLSISPALLAAAQTAGGSLGSLLAPAKLILGCATAGIKGREGEVLRMTLPWGLGIGFFLGVVTWLLSMV